jgi:hypothetical protein
MPLLLLCCPEVLLGLLQVGLDRLRQLQGNQAADVTCQRPLLLSVHVSHPACQDAPPASPTQHVLAVLKAAVPHSVYILIFELSRNAGSSLCRCNRTPSGNALPSP